MDKIRDTSGQDRPRQDRRFNRRTLGISLAIGVAALLTALAVPAFMRWSTVEQSVASERLRFGIVEQGPFTRDVSVQGRIVAAVSPTLYSPASGTVELMVQAGDAVELGQRLARIDSPELRSRLNQEIATLSGLETTLKRSEIDARTRKLAQQKVIDNSRVALTAAEREMRRAESAYEKQAISAIDYEQASDELERARLEFDHAEAESKLLADLVAFELETQATAVDRQKLMVQELERQVEQLEIVSPVTGMVGNLAVNDRAYVAANQPLLAVVDLTAFEVEVQIPESYAENLALGMPAEVRWGQELYPGVVAGISPEVANNQVTGRIRFDGDPPAGIRQNQRVSTRIVLEHKPDALFVRRGPFYDAGAGRIVYVVDDGTAERREVVTGATSVEKIEILDGLNAGERIVLSSTEGFGNAEKVMLTD